MDEPETQQWTLEVVLRVGLLFLLAGLTEIGGGWLVWQALREGKPWWWAACGSAVLVLYGFVPCLQPLSDFGRLYAVYGGVFIALSFLWGWGVDKMDVDKGDALGSVFCIVGVAIIMFWPRQAQQAQASGDGGNATAAAAATTSV